MKLSIWFACVVGLGVFALSEVGMSQKTTESACIVKLFDREDYKGQVKVQWSNEISTTFELKGTDKWLSSGPIRLPLDVKEVQIEGTLAWKHYRAGNQKSSGLSKRSLVDFTPVISRCDRKSRGASVWTSSSRH